MLSIFFPCVDLDLSFTPNLCDHCPITAHTTCDIQALAYARGLDGMSHCETHDDVVRMLDVMKSLGSRKAPTGGRKSPPIGGPRSTA